MLFNDINNSLGTVANAANTRILFRAVERHHRNNPQSSMEAAFEYIMLNSATFRALPAACIEKARKYLALHTVGIRPKGVTSEYNPSLFLVTPDKITPIGWECHASPLNIKIEASKELIKSKPGTTVVHAERVVVNYRKMIKILKFENVQLLSNLPNKYTADTPVYCWFRSGIELKFYDHPHTIHQNVLPGDILSLKEFDQMIKTMKEAGVRLSKINKTAKLEKEHSGKFTVSV